MPQSEYLEIRDIEFCTNVSNKILLNTAKCQGYGFNRFGVINGKLTGRVKLPLPPPRLELKKVT